jgi:hypothetical protein
MSLPVYVGWDPREDISYQVCEHSIKRRDPGATVIPLKQKDMRASGLYRRDTDRKPLQNSRSLVFLFHIYNDYKGWAVFCDCDFVWQVPTTELEQYCDDSKAVVCVQHDYTPKEGDIKMDGQVQTVYPRKNWSSMVLWNCAHPANKILTPEVLNKESGAFMHRFQWLADSEIGSSASSLQLVGGLVQGTQDGAPKILHYTEGGPWFEGYRDCEYADVWKKEIIIFLVLSKYCNGWTVFFRSVF